MPNYDFKCNDCNHKFSRNLPISERKNVQCPQCDSKNVKRLFTGFGLKTSSSTKCKTGG